MEQEVCDVGLSNATERDLNQRIANNIEVQDYLSHQMLFLPMFQHSANLFAVALKGDRMGPLQLAGRVAQPTRVASRL